MASDEFSDHIGQEWEERHLLQLRKILHVYDEETINGILIKYAEMVEMFEAAFPKWTKEQKIDWSIAVAMAPDWFGEKLTTRINNTMLVSALLITVTTALLLYPPQYALPYDDDDVSMGQKNLRWFFYLCSFCNILFVFSIITGIAFVENAVSRAYTESDKMVLIAKNYYVLMLSQITSNIGAFLFLIVLIIPTFKVYNYDDAAVGTTITVLLLLVMLLLTIFTNKDAGKSQSSKVEHFVELVGPDARLLAEYYPPTADVKPAYFKMMYASYTSGTLDNKEIVHNAIRRPSVTPI